MPLKPENKSRYPADWDEISSRIRFSRAQGRCECEGECRSGRHEGRCRNRHGGKAFETSSTVILTTAHLDHTPENCEDDNLKAMCQSCHLNYDAEHHAATASHTRAVAQSVGMEPLFPEEAPHG